MSGKSRVVIDGSYGEGGGQILRTSLALSAVTQKPFEIVNIRLARKKPGLQPQHLTAVKAAAAITSARTEGAELSSTALRFTPGPVKGGEYFFDVSEKRGSAGSTSLVLQTIMLPLLFAGEPSQVIVLGGTHVPWSPVFHYLQLVFLPAIARLGAAIDLDIEKWGWYPIGGGKVMLRVNPVRTLEPVTIRSRGSVKRISGVSAVANLPRDIAVRQRNQAMNALSIRRLDGEIEIVSAPSAGKGTLLFLLAEFENSRAGFGALGAVGKRAETVADEACHALFDHLDHPGALDPHLADQIIPYLALAGGTSEFTTSRITQHLLTNIRVVLQFLDVDLDVEGKEDEPGRVKCSS